MVWCDIVLIHFRTAPYPVQVWSCNFHDPVLSWDVPTGWYHPDAHHPFFMLLFSSSFFYFIVLLLYFILLIIPFIFISGILIHRIYNIFIHFCCKTDPVSILLYCAHERFTFIYNRSQDANDCIPDWLDKWWSCLRDKKAGTPPHPLPYSPSSSPPSFSCCLRRR